MSCHASAPLLFPPAACPPFWDAQASAWADQIAHDNCFGDACFYSPDHMVEHLSFWFSGAVPDVMDGVLVQPARVLYRIDVGVTSDNVPTDASVYYIEYLDGGQRTEASTRRLRSIFA